MEPNDRVWTVRRSEFVDVLKGDSVVVDVDDHGIGVSKPDGTVLHRVDPLDAGWERWGQGDGQLRLGTARLELRSATPEADATLYDAVVETKQRLLAQNPFDRIVKGQPATLLRTYHQQQHEEALAAFKEEIEPLSERGYVPGAQLWAPASRPVLVGIAGVILVLVGLLFVVSLTGLVLLLIGAVLILVYMGSGSNAALMVTFERRSESSPDLSSGDAGRTTKARLEELQSLHEEGLVTDEEYASRRAALLDAI